MNQNMRHMREHEALWAYGGINLFCRGISYTKQIFDRAFGDFCLILPHVPHVFQAVQTNYPKNMRQMREHEDKVFKGFYLFRIEKGVRRAPKNRKHEADMREHEDDPHVLGEVSGE